MTPAEAAEKWCPFARSQAEYAANRYDGDSGSFPRGCRCIADFCMAWRWNRHAIGAHPTSGFCGLAGDSNPSTGSYAP